MVSNEIYFFFFATTAIIPEAVAATLNAPVPILARFSSLFTFVSSFLA